MSLKLSLNTKSQVWRNGVFLVPAAENISHKNNPMDTFCPRGCHVPGMGSMDGAMVARNIPDPAFRHIHNRLHTPDMVEKKP